MSAPVRVGVIGCGAIATAVHLRALRGIPGVRVTCVADPDAAARERALRLVPDAAAASGVDELLAREDIDAVVVTAPSGLHAAMALATLAAGRHLYLEKPIATTAEDGRCVAEAARRAGVVTAIGFNWRFQPLVARARELLADGVLGRIREASSAFTENGPLVPWKTRRDQGGGVLLDLGSHHFDLFRWLLGVEVTKVDATVLSGGSEQESATVRLAFGDGCHASSYFSLRETPSFWIEVVGERGRLRLDRVARTLTLDGARARTLTPAMVAWRAKAVLRPRTEPSWGYALRAFVQRIAGRDVALPSCDDGLRSLEIVEAAERAAGI